MCFNFRVTILKDQNHRSKGVAFVLFLDRDGAHKCVRALNKTEVTNSIFIQNFKVPHLPYYLDVFSEIFHNS